MNSSLNSFSSPLIHLSETRSTNSYLKSLCASQQVKEFTTVVADFQTNGRGQLGNTWESEPQKNLLFSTVLMPVFLEARCQFLISQIISLAIKEELDVYTDGISIKWPNDIYWHEKKIAGILIENDLMGTHIHQCIAGVGLNINQEKFYSAAPNPVSLYQITRKQQNTLTILRNIMLRICSCYNLLKKGDTDSIIYRYEQALFRKEGMYRYKDVNGAFLARIVRVEPGGRLILEDETQTKRSYMFKEVEYLLK